MVVEIMIPNCGIIKTFVFFKWVMIFIVLGVLGLTGCSPPQPPLSPEATVFNKEVSKILSRMQQSLGKLIVQGDLPQVDAFLQRLAPNTLGICIDCPYKLAVLNGYGDLLTTFPKNEIVGRNFSAYKTIKEALQNRKITQRKAFMPDGSTIYFISAPLIHDKKVVGVAALILTPNDVQQKWHLSEQEFFTIDFNTP